MNITKEQFKELGEFHIDDFPIDSSDQDLMFELFNHLPVHDKMLAIEWRFNDTVFNDNVFEFLCNNQLNISCEEYYDSKIAHDYFTNGKTIEIDFAKLSHFKAF